MRLDEGRGYMFYGNSHLQSVLTKESTGLIAPLQAINHFRPIISNWEGAQWVLDIKPSGSYAKLTAVKCSADVDLFISISESLTNNLREIYGSLSSYMKRSGYNVRRQNVSIRVPFNNSFVDLVPGQRQNAYSSDHSLYVSKRDTWQKTNIDKHISEVKGSGRTDAIKLIKIWREKNSLEFPSLYLELAVIRALNGTHAYDLESQLRSTLGWLATNIMNVRFQDPANTNNILSDDLTQAEKGKIAAQAAWDFRQTDVQRIL